MFTNTSLHKSTGVEEISEIEHKFYLSIFFHVTFSGTPKNFANYSFLASRYHFLQLARMKYFCIVSETTSSFYRMV